MIIPYDDFNKDAKREFIYLIEKFGYKIIEDKITNNSGTLIYEKDEVRINLHYDYRDNFFSFKIIRGKDTKYPNDNDFTNIKTFYELFQKKEGKIDFEIFQPSDNDYKNALANNAKLLNKYGDKLLEGKEWI